MLAVMTRMFRDSVYVCRARALRRAAGCSPSPAGTPGTGPGQSGQRPEREPAAMAAQAPAASPTDVASPSTPGQSAMDVVQEPAAPAGQTAEEVAPAP